MGYVGMKVWHGICRYLPMYLILKKIVVLSIRAPQSVVEIGKGETGYKF